MGGEFKLDSRFPLGKREQLCRQLARTHPHFLSTYNQFFFLCLSMSLQICNQFYFLLCLSLSTFTRFSLSLSQHIYNQCSRYLSLSINPYKQPVYLSLHIWRIFVCLSLPLHLQPVQISLSLFIPLKQQGNKHV